MISEEAIQAHREKRSLMLNAVILGLLAGALIAVFLEAMIRGYFR